MAEGYSSSEKKAVLALVMMSSFLTPFMASSINVALPDIASEFSMDAVLLSWVATSYLLAAAIFLVPFGRIADIKGRKRVFVYGLWVFTFSSLLCALSTSDWLLISFRIAQGVGSAMMFGTGTAMLISAYPPQERGKAIGLTTALVYVGLSSGPFAGGFLTAFFGWRSLFVVLLPVCAATAYLGSTRVKSEWAEARGESFDLRGSIMYAFSLTAIILGFSFLPDILGAFMSGLGLVGMLVFARLESRTPRPVLDVNLFLKNRPFAFSNLAALINYSATFGVTLLMSLYLQYVKGFDPEKTGIILVAQPVVMAAFSPLAGKLSDVVEPRIIASGGMAITTLGLVLLSLMTETTEVIYIVISLAVLGFGFALFSSPNTNAIMGSVGKKFLGVASATVGTMRLVGQVLSVGLATLALAVYLGSAELSSELSSEFMQSYRLAFTVFAAMCFVGIFASLARGKVRGRPT